MTPPKSPAKAALLALLALLVLPFPLFGQHQIEPQLLPEPATAPATATFAVPSFQKELRLGPLVHSPASQEETELKGRLQIGTLRNFSQPARVNRTTVGRSEWTTLPDQSRIWAAQIVAEQAQGLRVHVQDVELPAGATLIVYAPGQAGSGSSISAEELGNARELWLPTVPGEEAIVECRVPEGVDPGAVRFELDGVSHLYESPAVSKAGSCENDVSCFDGWARAASGIGRLTFVENGNTYLCTGALIMGADPAAAARLFLTANHCIPNQSVAATLEIYWFFQTKSCGGPPPSLSETPRTTGGAEFLAGSGSSDFTLLRLRASPPPGVFYLQWTTATPSPGESVTTLHHPGGSWKRISLGSVTRVDENFTRVRWSSGVTERGSSGAPLLNAAQQIIGQLYGGSSSCSNPSGIDSFGRFSVTFQSIRQWLEGSSTAPPIAVTMPRASYSGLFQKPDGFSATTSGSINIVSGTRNLFSGSIRMISGVHPFSGRFDSSGNASIAVRRGSWPTLTLRLHADRSNFSVLTGTIGESSWTAQVTANRAVYNGTTQSAPQTGRFTLVLLNAGPDSVPGIAVSTISRAGVVNLAAKVPGMGTWTQSGRISGGGDFPLFVNIGPQQVLSGWIGFGAGFWATPSGSLTASRNGDVEWIGIDGSRYVPPSAGSPVLPGSQIDVTLNGQGLDYDLAYSVGLGTRRKASAANASRGKITITFASNGMFGGVASDPAAPGPLPFTGVVLQNSERGTGYFRSSAAIGTVRVFGR